MGLFSRKKKSPGQLPSPSPSLVTIVPSPPVSPAICVPAPVFKPQVVLRAALDPAPLSGETTFTVMVDFDSTLDVLRKAISEHTGSTSMSLFKVSIPMNAQTQAIEYQRRFSIPVNLLTSFPAFNMDDPRQLTQSFAGGWSSSPRESDAGMRVCDWFPESPSAEIISILVRTSESSSTADPVTFITHFAPSEPSSASSARLTRLAHKAPTVVTAPTSYTIRNLKAAILRADGRKVVEEHLDRVILWQVEMSEEEMVIIGERGGLKNGRMPWPYPPGAPVPVAMSDDTLPISHYFPQTSSNARMISISVWLDSVASASMPAPAATAPAFRYPMDFAALDAPITAPAKKTRQRPSTAPAAVVTVPGQDSLSAVPAFGSRSLSSLRVPTTPQPDRLQSGRSNPTITLPPRPSPLSFSTVPPQRGLGISSPTTDFGPSDWAPSPRVNTVYGISRSNTLPRGSVSSSCSSTDESHLPSLSFSQLSLTLDPNERDSAGPLTPEATEKAGDWLDRTPTMDGKKGVRVTFADQKWKKFAF